MSQRGLAYLYGLGSILPLAFFIARYRAGGQGSDFWAIWNALWVQVRTGEHGEKIGKSGTHSGATHVR